MYRYHFYSKYINIISNVKLQFIILYNMITYDITFLIHIYSIYITL